MTEQARATAIGVLTSGGDAQGMNAAVRAVVRTALASGARVYAIYEGYQGMVDGGDRIREMSWGDVGGIMHRGGTVIGTARSEAFRTREGRLRAVEHLVERGIDRLVVIGGDGSLTGAHLFRQEWPGLLAELESSGRIGREAAARHGGLVVLGLVGSIDNDLVGIDMTIGADSALHRITDALDALGSTAASHQRVFVVEVMGRDCGYLALMGAVAGGADYVLLPEQPPDDGWEDRLGELVRAGRAAGRRDCLVVVAEGARDERGQPISSEYVRRVLEQRLDEEARVTILGHVQRGGAPSAFDRWMSTLVGAAAADEALSASPDAEPHAVGIRYNRVARVPLMQAVDDTRAAALAIASGDYDRAMRSRGGSFAEMWTTFTSLSQALPTVSSPVSQRRIAVLNAGGLASGMNTAVRAAVRLGLDRGHTMLGVHHGVDGLVSGDIVPIEWGSVDGWNSRGGAELGTSRTVPTGRALAAAAEKLLAHRIDAILMIGGWTGYETAEALAAHRSTFAAFDLPILCLPASINNDLPGSEVSIGADTALNVIVRALDGIKQSAVAVRRCFVVEVMGRYCGYLALMSGLASGAERVYLHEWGVSLADLQADLARMTDEFRAGKRLNLVVRNEYANERYSTEFMSTLFAEEGHGLFDVRRAVLGHLQQGGDPSPFDRIQATRLAARGMAWLDAQLKARGTDVACIGFVQGRVQVSDLADAMRRTDRKFRRPREQWWLELEAVAGRLAQPAAPA
ncbi:MAG: 6-phosphofructokinase [Acidobacteria bacterium]|nr:6-phosphofructokinase [Acidobacteriota bacterium]